MTRVDGMNERRAAYDRRLTDAKRLTPDERQQVANVDREISDMARQMGVPRSALKNRSLDKDARAQLEAELRRLGDGMRVLHQRRQALANPWLKDGPRKKNYEDALREATRAFRKDSEIVVKVAMNDVFAPMKDAARIEIPGASVAYRSASRQDAPAAFFEGTTSPYAVSLSTRRPSVSQSSRSRGISFEPKRRSNARYRGSGPQPRFRPVCRCTRQQDAIAVTGMTRVL